MSPKIRRSIKKTKIQCGQCKLDVKEEEDDIECDKCGKIFHALCTTLDKRQYNYLLQNEREEYVCHMCNESGGSVRNELNEMIAKQNEIKTKLNKLDQLDAIQETIRFMSEQFDDMLKGIADNKKKLEAVQKENKNLKNEIEDLKSAVKFLNDNRVKNDCIINGIEVKDDSNAVETLVKIMNNVGVNIQPDEIEDAYFLKKRNDDKTKSKKQSMVVKFTNNKSKKTVMSTKPKLKNNDDTKAVFINDYLSKETLTLLNYAKTLKEVGYRSVYPMAGKVYTKMSELSRPKFIKNADEVDNLLIAATQHRKSLGRDKAAIDNTSDNEDEADDSYLSPA